MLKRYISLLLTAWMISLLSAGYAVSPSVRTKSLRETGIVPATESANQDEKDEIDLDLTDLIGTPLLTKLTEICAEPDVWDGHTLRVKGQYFVLPSGDSVRRSLIVCDSCQCSEIGILLVSSDGLEDIWPENLQNVEITGTLEKYETAAGDISLRLRVFDLVAK